ncbi:hypothetical protein [Haloarcula sp. CBA1131]|uniref:hypothetical protein n=1 Tax=Haloarcula sp. CBA1131 TaxID=1853686 RepID=UPI0012462891|nr:hypothetical protein [Haloarcula sp. CBA1131]
MDRTTANDLVDRAFAKVRSDESFLLQNNVHERSIVHKFAAYLQQEFDNEVGDEEVVVDCEYNRENHGDTKTLPKPQEDNEEDQIYPDVIVHKRGNHSKNLLVIEAKKETNKDNFKSDKKRLRILTNDGDHNKRYNYDQGVFLLIYVNDNWEKEIETEYYPKD